MPQHRSIPRVRLAETASSAQIFTILAALLVVCALGGGSNRGDVPSLIYLRTIAALAIGLLVLLGADPRTQPIRRPLWWLFAASVLLAVLHLLPLPPGLWTQLPGRGAFIDAASIAGVPQPWRPLTIVPDLGLNSLASLLVPGAVLLACSTRHGGFRDHGLIALIALGFGSAFVGLVQLVGGPNGPLYIYPDTANGLPIGFFANRNHQALMLAMMLPLLAAWVRQSDAHPKRVGFRCAIAGGGALLLLPVMLATGSRSGFVLTGIALLAAFALLPWHRLERRQRRVIIASLFVGVVFIVLATVVSGRALVLTRLTSGDELLHDMRIASAPTTLQLLRDSLPFGTGLGTFDPLFRTLEPDALLTPTYRNHAHNDLLELAMTAGLPGLAILLGFVGWFARTTWRVYRAPSDGRRVLGLASATGIGLMMLASLTDYPLRVPLMQALLILFSVWLVDAAAPECHSLRSGKRSSSAV